MASHGRSRHQKRLSAPYAQPVHRKTTAWLVNASPGKHPREHSVPLLVLLRDMLGTVKNSREAKRVILAGDVLVDGAKATDIHAPVGVMDVVSLPKAKKFVRVVLKRDRVSTVDVSEAQTAHKLCRVQNKSLLPGGKVQLNLHDGRNVTIERKDDSYHPGDSLKIALPAQKLEGAIRMEKGAHCYVAYGRHSGQQGLLEKIMERAGSKPADALLKDEKGAELITLKNYLFAVDSHFKA